MLFSPHKTVSELKLLTVRMKVWPDDPATAMPELFSLRVQV